MPYVMAQEHGTSSHALSIIERKGKVALLFAYGVNA